MTTGTVTRGRSGVPVGPDDIRTNRVPSVQDIAPDFYNNLSELDDGSVET
jgi:hypothetical protein